ncbi:hypothetical protein RFI_29030 [Reticulomyxa filosa]|uniref:Uncharacterized protein n=1 Tax=Reticulomyxa filosa TaxID=46433 RepID=X6M443_RETFI|nr:hypothetical protein RFI_29030 [Reticulomyxa filosa]|eukprot:ETO08361.1 hypothetical protein RFI_29030 [Reticulomyxa filosa]
MTWTEEDLNKIHQELLQDLNDTQRTALNTIFERHNNNYDKNDKNTKEMTEDLINETTQVAIENKITNLIKQLNEEKLDTNKLQTTVNELIHQFQTKSTNEMHLRISLQNQIQTLTHSKLRLINTTASQLLHFRSSGALLFICCFTICVYI